MFNEQCARSLLVYYFGINSTDTDASVQCVNYSFNGMIKELLTSQSKADFITNDHDLIRSFSFIHSM